jgi:hypothetical protein
MDSTFDASGTHRIDTNRQSRLRQKIQVASFNANVDILLIIVQRTKKTDGSTTSPLTMTLRFAKSPETAESRRNSSCYIAAVQ